MPPLYLLPSTVTNNKNRFRAWPASNTNVCQCENQECSNNNYIKKSLERHYEWEINLNYMQKKCTCLTTLAPPSRVLPDHFHILVTQRTSYTRICDNNYINTKGFVKTIPWDVTISFKLITFSWCNFFRILISRMAVIGNCMDKGHSNVSKKMKTPTNDYINSSLNTVSNWLCLLYWGAKNYQQKDI